MEKNDGHNEGSNKKVLKVNMAKLSCGSNGGISESSSLMELAYESLLDDGAPYSAVGNTELQSLAPMWMRDRNKDFGVRPKILARFSHCVTSHFLL